MKYTSKKTEETLLLGEKIGKKLFAGAVIALEGDLGGGKTTFTKGLAKGLGIKEEVVSPSFTLEKVYQFTDHSSQIIENNLSTVNREQIARLYHFDFYRIDNPKDMVGYELAEALDDPKGIVVVEWAEKIEAELPKEKLVVKFEYVGENEREIILKSFGGRYKELIKV